ncbi:MAG: NAD(P)/FAD-dependent oxidoreductase [Treponema sp.]|jgi:electron-transferring-flavoprotein dehydrogenase|nr:NAD(P)/FAD-dependent oxidoreductase [Treponema sp.]
MKEKTDVLVIGACTAGLYFAGLMAQKGFRVLVCDRSSTADLGCRYDIIHIGEEYFSQFGLPKPGPGDEDYVETFHKSILVSALNNYPKNNSVDILVLRRVPFMRRLTDWARSCGAEVSLETEFVEPLFDETGKLCGALLRKDGAKLRVKARLTVDASGIDAAVRVKLPNNYGVENFVTGPRDQFYVVLRYVTLKNPTEDKPQFTKTWPYYKTWIAPQQDADGAILGIGANLSFDYAQRCWERFCAKGFLPEHEVQYIEQSSTPYRRPPYSFVADGFIALGDAACVTNPWSGEGVPYAWFLCSIAAEEFAEVMKNGVYPTQTAAWAINTRYQRSQGAEFAQNLAMLSGAVDCSPKENDYEFAHSIIFEDEHEKGKHNFILGILKGVLFGGISVKSLMNLVKAASTGGKILKHYRSFPENPSDFGGWTAKANVLWAGAGSMTDLAERDSV